MMNEEIVAFEPEILRKGLKDNFCGGRFIGKPVQGMCYDSRNRKYVAGFSHNNNPQLATLVKLKRIDFADSSVEIIKEGLMLAHCNDLEYDPDVHKIYAALGTHRIAVIDPDTLEVLAYHPVSMYAWAIARYPDGSWFIHDGNNGWWCDRDFTESRAISDRDTAKVAAALGVPYDESKQCYRGYWQGAIMIENTPFMIYTEWSDKADVFSSCTLVSFESWKRGSNGADGMEIFRYPTPYEFESGCVVDRSLKMAFGNIFIGGAEWDMSEMAVKTVVATVKNVALPVNANVAIDFSPFVPKGYELVSAIVSYKRGSLMRTLPYCDDDGKCVARVLKCGNNHVYIRSSEKSKPTTFQITGFCRRIG